MTSEGHVWLLVTRNGRSDPRGTHGYVMEFGGSGCRWLPLDLADPVRSLGDAAWARAWHAQGDTA